MQAQEPVSIDKVIAVIGKNIILESDVRSQEAQYKARGINLGGDMRCTIFEELLFQSLLLNQAKIDSLEVSEKQVEGELNRRISMFIKQMGGQDKMEAYFHKTVPEIKNDFRSIIRDQMLTQQMQGQITSGILISPSNVRKFFRKIPKDSLPLVESQVEISQIVIVPKIKDEEREYYRNKLKKLRKEIVDGADFETKATIYSEDVASAIKGGDLGFVARNELVPEFAEAGFSLRTKGELSDIVETDFGFHLIQFVERKGERVRLRHILIIPKVQPEEKARAKSKLDSIAKAIRAGDITFEKAARAFSEDEKSKYSGGVYVNPRTGTSSFESSQIEPTTNYVVKNLKVAEISSPFVTKNSKGKEEYKIITVKSKTKAHISSLNTDYQLISDMALEKKKEKEVSRWIKEKQATTYMKIDKSYHSCKYKYKGWLSTEF